ncbi:MAG TPA: hypothetical protein VN858_07135 [Casimicrobiaceae bacterium]|nr:hypothetical protein [Casimicrobiaceae bacterium]
MPASGTARRTARIGWRANGDSFDVALAVNRLLAADGRVRWVTRSSAAADAGDYVVEASPAQLDALAHLGVMLESPDQDLLEDAVPLARPAVRLFAGTASKYPYFAYYALCLLRLGIDYVACDGASLARGTLDDANLLILPGGFATWGIDAAEDAPGADARVRAFLANGGTAIGSCGGAFYLSAGRPGWTATANANPLYTHEYLQSGVAIVSVALGEGPLAFGCPPTIDVPYYHGPIYDALGDGIDVAATYRAFVLQGRLAIDNPLGREQFERDMKGKPAILLANGARGRAVLFSPHPEMGDLIRKYIALDGYVRHYLPIRGVQTMRDTLRHYRVNDAPSFRLVLNAAHSLLDDRLARRMSERAVALRDVELSLQPAEACRRALDALPDFGSGDEGDLLRDVAARIAARFEAISPRFAAAIALPRSVESLVPAWQHLSATMAKHDVGGDATIAHRLMEADLAVSLVECWTRTAEVDRALAST